MASKQSAAEYYLKNRNRILARNKAYYERNKERIAAQNAVWFKKNKKRIMARHAEYQRKNKDRVAKWHANYYKKNKARIAVREAKRLQALRNQAYDMYGVKKKGHEHGVCSCPGCGADLVMFGTLSHIDGSGGQRRKDGQYINKMLRDAIAHYDPTKFAVECYNCNCAAERNGGICPHRKGRR